jgi:hypothetical protein
LLHQQQLLSLNVSGSQLVSNIKNASSLKLTWMKVKVKVQVQVQAQTQT